MPGPTVDWRNCFGARGVDAESRIWEGAMSETSVLAGRDLPLGVPAVDVPENGTLLGHAHGEAVFLTRRGEECFALGAVCSHYGGPLAEGLIVGETVRCPWHHACFDLRTGEALRGPALSDVSSW